MPPIPVVLGSVSPRRRELLGGLVPHFEVVTADVDEDAHTVEDPWHTAERLALMKARAVAALRPNALVIGGDTVVALPRPDGSFEQLAKPVDFDDACRMLGLLSGQTHRVITGVALVWPEGEEVFHDESHVTFRELSEFEIRDYVGTGEPMDKAGAYAVQAGGGTFIAAIDGSRTNVIGLPMEKLEARLRALFEELFHDVEGVAQMRNHD